MPMENSSDTIGNQTRNIPACSSLPQPTALPRASDSYLVCYASLFRHCRRKCSVKFMCAGTMLFWFKLVAVCMQLFVRRHNNFLFWIVQYVEFSCYLGRDESGAQMYCPPSLFGR